MCPAFKCLIYICTQTPDFFSSTLRNKIWNIFTFGGISIEQSDYMPTITNDSLVHVLSRESVEISHVTMMSSCTQLTTKGVKLIQRLPDNAQSMSTHISLIHNTTNLFSVISWFKFTWALVEY